MEVIEQSDPAFSKRIKDRLRVSYHQLLAVTDRKEHLPTGRRKSKVVYVTAKVLIKEKTLKTVPYLKTLHSSKTELL